MALEDFDTDGSVAVAVRAATDGAESTTAADLALDQPTAAVPFSTAAVEPPFGAILTALGLELQARRARFASARRQPNGVWTVNALLHRQGAEQVWHAQFDTVALAALIARAIPQIQVGTHDAYIEASAEQHSLLLRALRHTGDRLARQRHRQFHVLIDCAQGVLLATDDDGLLIALDHSFPDHQQLHPGQQALYRQRAGNPPMTVTIRRLGKNQIQVTLPDGALRAVHRKWLSSAPTGLPEQATAPEPNRSAPS